MACKTLARLCHGAPLDDGFMQVTPPVVYSVIPLCKVGNDDTGNKLISLLENCGEACRNVETKYIKNARSKDPSARTALAVLPIYRDGRRGCFFDAASNATFSPFEMLELINNLAHGSSGPDLDKSDLSVEDMEHYQEQMGALSPPYGAFLFGYPHLLPKMQGKALVSIFEEARFHMQDGGIVAMDLNGVPEAVFQESGGFRTVSDLKNDPVIGPALEHVDILHMNEDELMLLTGCELEGTDDSQLEDEYVIARAVNLFLLCGVAVVAVTRGKRGSFVSCNNQKRLDQSKML
jgi:sugar/nucleoside kinase (ribokinase family)